MDGAPLPKVLLARSYIRAGRPEAAVELLARLAETDPTASALNELGAALLAAGQPLRAVEVLRSAARMTPDDAAVAATLGNALRLAGAAAEAEVELRRAIARDPALAAAWHDLALVLWDRAPAEAERCLREAARLLPGHAPILADLAALLAIRGEDAEAAEAAEAAAACAAPDDAAVWRCLAGAMAKLDRPEECLNHAEKAAALLPDSPAHLADLAAARLEMNDWRGALAAAERAVAIVPDEAGAHFAASLALLMSGDYAEGFRRYEWRWRTEMLKPNLRPLSRPAWDGGAPAGRTIFVTAEQGFGDQIMAARFAPLLARRGARVLLECPQPLARLFAGLPGVAGLVPWKGEPESYDVHVPVISLPHRLGITLDTLPAAPYLRAPGDGPPLPPSRPGRPVRLGVCWGSKPRPRDRGCPPALFAELAARFPVTLYSLVKGPLEGEVAQFPPDLRPETVEVRDFADTAAVMEKLDLIVTVDTAVAHLAGALGRPVWILLRFGADWRWLLERADSPWYPTARLFRQPRPGDWAGVFAAVGEALGEALGRLNP